MGAREWLLLFALSALWGGSFFFFKVLVAALPPFTVVLGRVGFAAIALNLLLAVRRDWMPADPRLWASFALMGLLNNVAPFTLIVFGETRISSGLASILNATTPIFTVLVAHALTGNEKLSWGKAVGVAFGLAGVVVLVGPGVLSGLGQGDLVGEAACLLASLCYACAGVYGRRFRGVPPLKLATGQITASTLVLAVIASLVDRPWTLPAPGAPIWLAFAGISLLCTALAYVLYFRILAVAGATNLLLVTFLLPISAMTLGALFLGESFGAQAFVGMALIGAGLAAIDGRAVKSTHARLARTA
ncbi:MAG: DMT family transporter [Pseudomonadota bacterium]|nr:DMT family transporter [Pseudomonadota bacterium]